MTPEEAAAEFGVDHLVTPSAARSTLDCHLPDPDDPERPRCDMVPEDRSTRPIDPERAGHRGMCSVCTGEAQSADSSGPRLAHQLADPEVESVADLDSDDVATDGGGPRAE
jgi:hypothetical protein